MSKKTKRLSEAQIRRAVRQIERRQEREGTRRTALGAVALAAVEFALRQEGRDE